MFSTTSNLRRFQSQQCDVRRIAMQRGRGGRLTDRGREERTRRRNKQLERERQRESQRQRKRHPAENKTNSPKQCKSQQSNHNHNYHREASNPQKRKESVTAALNLGRIHNSGRGVICCF